MVVHPIQDMKAGSLTTTCIEIEWIILKTTTVRVAGSTGLCHQLGNIETVEETSMIGKGSRDSHHSRSRNHHQQCCHLPVLDGHMVSD